MTPSPSVPSVSIPSVSIIVPMLNEIEQLPDLLEQLRFWQDRGCEVIIVDGGSQDGSAAATTHAGFRVIEAEPGRGRQMNAGARAACGEALLFLHADTRLPDDADRTVTHALTQGHMWGRFDLRIEGRTLMLKVVSAMVNLRSRLSGVATGDQAIFVRRSIFEALGGFVEQPLMEDIELSGRLKALAPPACLSARVTTSGRRWEARGVWRTIFLMWRLRLAYWRGVPPEVLAREYR
ncbi:MAG: glycosyltransferase [Sphingobium sp.]|nr:MAG: glycosyltransferase [Sphingobium sp.]